MVSAAKVDRNPNLSEAHIKRTCSEWLALDSWRWIDTDPPGLRGLGVREKGIADRLYIRYFPGLGQQPWMQGCEVRAIATVLWIEWKKVKGRNASHQIAWQLAERAKGALVWLAGQDFPATIEDFQAHYRKSGLMRRRI